MPKNKNEILEIGKDALLCCLWGGNEIIALNVCGYCSGSFNVINMIVLLILRIFISRIKFTKWIIGHFVKEED